MQLSVIIPVYNKHQTLGTILVLVGRALPHVSKEIVIVDDNSKDGTCEWLKANFPHGERSGSTVDLDTNGNLVFNQAPGPSTVNMRPIYHEQNRCKGGGRRADSLPFLVTCS